MTPKTTGPKNPSDAGNVSKVSMRVQDLREITQLSGQFELKAPTAQPPFTAQIGLPTTQVKTQDHVVTVIADFLFEGREALKQAASAESDRQEEDKDERPVVIRIAATLMVRYNIEPGPDLDEVDLRAFGRVNGILNLWPFWREYVHSTLSRAGLSPFPLPPFNPAKMAADRNTLARSEKTT